ncbi:hypothetical protein Desti_5450 [Desulfomonile tiedjei DSM 6799]|uniref:Uncharacterized protein n=1 Tax=Desulfomonile tiedjei (strain ATCC 49306 / DSM 6799 / DCB-1) TaxID=706587 RepID=I4CEP5_DESTA|nr:hypothetical protein Desti_5450 [Desulfomonile tiedjei DSM 6799]
MLSTVNNGNAILDQGQIHWSRFTRVRNKRMSENCNGVREAIRESPPIKRTREKA